ncbi:CARDB domain-containing protein [Spirosoma endbachense]|nr:CARDB domain-containing protein [Spirosoma endbachense]
MNLFLRPLLLTGLTAMLWAIGLLQAVAQIDVTYPVSRMIVQRDNNNNATVLIAGSYAQLFDSVEARAVVRTSGQGTTTNWATLQTNPLNGQFNGTLTITGGWYRIEVRGKRNGQVVASDSVDRFGVGEVFAIVGHSNAQGSSCIINNTDYCPTMPGAVDDRVTVVPLDQSTPEFARYDTTANTRYLPGLTFSQLSTFSGISPFAKMSWFWGHMGDLLVQRINVPVLIYNAGFGGSNMEYNYKAAYDIPFTHGFIRYAIRMPYVNLRNLMNLYVPSTGIRAILLQHGENDRGNPTDLIVTHHYGVIDKVRQEFGKPNLAWIIALSSFAGAPFDNVRQAQLQVINRQNYLTYQGPDLDNVNSPADRPDGIHFSPSGQTQVGALWANAISNSYLQSIQPYLAENQLFTSIACAPGNQLMLTQPAGYQYIWNTGDSIQSLTVGAGTYSARLLNPQNKAFFPPAVTVPSVVRPSTPTITVSGSMSLCQPGSVTLTSSYAGTNLWSTSAVTSSILATQVGAYSVQAVNSVYGCQSNPTSITISNAMTDLSLSLGVSRRTAAVGDTVTFSLTVKNEGSCDAGAVTMQNRLPDNVVFVSSSTLTSTSGVVSGSLANVAPGQSITRQYVARLTAPGMYQNAGQLTAQARIDPDSQPNSGTGDGQDDAAMVDLRTTSTAGALSLFASPNPNQTPLPPIQSNQPTPNPSKADLSLTMELSQRYVRTGENITVTLKVFNLGGLTATGIVVKNDLPAGMQFVSSPSGMTTSGSSVTGSIGQLAAGQTASLSFTATVTGQGNFTNVAQIMACNQSDPDSTPGNGTTNGEDDTARVDLRATSASGARIAATPNSVAPLNKEATNTTPTSTQGHRFSDNAPKK